MNNHSLVSRMNNHSDDLVDDSTPPHACEQVAEQMAAQVNAWQACGDRRAIFLDCYLRMTRNMLTALAGNEFQDSAWVDRLLRRFAGHYFDALDAYEHSRAATPPVWRIAHDAAVLPGAMTLQNLFLGVNAHINYDLVLTLVELLAKEWDTLDGAGRQSRFADYSHVNVVIGRTIDIVQDEIVEPATPGLRLVDALFGPLDEWATEQLIVNWREAVWRHAVAMLDTADPAAREQQRQAVEAATLRRAELMLGRIGR